MASSRHHSSRDRERDDRKGRSHHSGGHKRTSHRHRSRSRSASPEEGNSSNHHSSDRHWDERDKDRHRRRDEREKGKEREHCSHSHRHRSSHEDDNGKRSRKEDTDREHRHCKRSQSRDRDGGRVKKSRKEGNHSDKERNYEEAMASIPTLASLALTSTLTTEEALPPSTESPRVMAPQAEPTESKMHREDWMLGADAAPGDAVPKAIEMDDKSQEPSGSSGGIDFFSSLGHTKEKSARQLAREAAKEKRDPEKLQVSSRELNTQFAQGKSLDEYDEVPTGVGASSGHAARAQPGGPGYAWRMMKLKRTFEAAESEGRDLADVALERYGSMEAFEEAKGEREWLDRRDQEKRNAGTGSSTQQGAHAYNRSYMVSGLSVGEYSSFTHSPLPGSGASTPRPLSQQSFRKPGSAPTTPGVGASGGSRAQPAADPFARLGAAARKSNSSLRQRGCTIDSGASRSGTSTPPVASASSGVASDASKSGTPIPSVFAPVVPRKSAAATAGAGTVERTIQHSSDSTGGGEKEISAAPVLDQTALNKLKARVMKAEMMGKPDTAALQKEYERELTRSETASIRAYAYAQGGDEGEGYFGTDTFGRVRDADDDGEADDGHVREVHVLPTLDGRGQLYDVGRGTNADAAQNRAALPGNRRKNSEKFETRDSKTGELLRYNADDDTQTLSDLIRQERFAAGASSVKNADAELASRIMRDGKYRADVDYMDDNVERLARKNMKSDAMKRQFAIQDFAQTKRALDTCQFCWQDEGARPPRANVIASGSSAYLALPERESLVADHCLIVPVQHHLSSLELDDDCWDEIKNFMKCLMQMAAKKNEGCIFFETILSFKQQRHTYIECLTLPWDLYLDAPAYFKESILASEQEWTQHKKLIDFSERGGFRNSLVAKLPYFMVQWDYKGLKGYGHIIEGQETAEHGENGEIDAANETGLGGQAFPKWFAQEIVGNLLDMEPRRWRKPRRLDYKQNSERIAGFKKRFSDFDWTKMLDTVGGGGDSVGGGGGCA